MKAPALGSVATSSLPQVVAASLIGTTIERYDASLWTGSHLRVCQ
ncbi:hypothetical protein [Kitasatospora sp. SUK 42]|nr:hypothetical protein [Kitasatospora sp. SUK 42]